MKIRQLEYFCAVAEEKSISAAARKLHVAQPPVSRQIALLEYELGAQLFLRGNKGMSLTEAGENLYEHSRQLMDSMEHIAANIRNMGSGISGTVKIGVVYSAIPYALKHISKYHEKYPQVELFIRQGPPEELLADLNRGTLNVLFLRSFAQDSTGLHERILSEDKLELIMTAETDPAPEIPEIPMELLHKAPMCLLRSDDLWRYGEDLLRGCQKKGYEPNVVCHCYDTPTVMQMVQAGFGVGFLPRSIVETSPNAGVYSKPVRGVSERSYTVLVWNDDAYRFNSVRLLTELK